MTQTLTSNIETLTSETSLSVELLSAYLKVHESYINGLIDLLIEYGQKKHEEELKLSYHLNVIDELHINENSHSRILHKLLLYRSPNGDYPILQSLVSQLGEKCSSFKTIKIQDPIITQEKERIDLWVRDKTYTLIFENKVYNAKDQEAQLERYVEKSLYTHKYRHNLGDIYVVYMPQRSGEPAEQSWGRYKGSSIEKMRYVNFSFLDGVLPWLKYKIISSATIGYDTKDELFHTAIKQYIDYLEGLFSLRNYQQPMNTTLENLIKDRLNLNECKDDFEKFEKLAEQYDECTNLRNKLGEMQNKVTKKIKEKWQSQFKEKFPTLHVSPCATYIDAIVPTSEGKVFVRIEKDSAIYCQAEFEDLHQIDSTILSKLYKENMLDETNGNNKVWKYFEKNPTHEAFDCFIKVVEFLCKQSH